MKGALKPADAAALIPDGASLLIGGFMGEGGPERLIDALVGRGARDLTVIANDTAMPGRGIGKLISAGAVRRLVACAFVTGPTSGIGLGDPTGIEALRMGSEADTGAPVALEITGTAIPVDGR